MMKKLIVLFSICLMILPLLPWSRCDGENNQEGIQTQTNSGGWEQEWIGGFGIIRDITYSQDGSKIAVAGSSVVHILNASTYEIEKQLSGPNRKIYSAAFSPDGNRIASADGIGNVEIWDNYEEEKVFSVSNISVLSVCWSPDGNRIATGDDEGHLKVFDVETGVELINVIAHTDGVTSVNFLFDGKKIVSGGGAFVAGTSYDNTVKLWNTTSGELVHTFEGHTDGITSVSFSSDGKKILSGSRDDTIKIWDAEYYDCLKTFEEHTGDVNDVEWSKNDDKILSCSDDATIKIWDVETGDVLHEFEDDYDVMSAAWSNDDEMVVSGSEGCKLKIWDVESENLVNELWGHTNYINSIDASPDKKKLVSGSSDYTVRIWDAEKGECLKTLEAHTDWVNCVAWSPDGRYIASCGDYANPVIKIWDANTYSCLHTLSGHTGGVTSIAWSPDSKKIVSAAGGPPYDVRIIVWDVESEEKTLVINNVQAPYCVAWSPDGKYIVAGNSARDGIVKIYDAETGVRLATKVAHDFDVYAIKWSHDSKKFASGSWKSIKVWEWDDTNNEIVFQENMDQSYIIASFDWSKDDSKLMSTSKEIVIWDVENAQCLSFVKGHEGDVYPYVKGAVWLSDNRIASCAGDRTVRVWKAVLSVNVSFEPKILSEDSTVMNIHVSYMGEPISNADITVSSDIGSLSKTSGKTDIYGNFETVFYAPTVIRNTTCNIRITASKLGSEYGDGKINIPIIVYPKILLINIEGETNVFSNKSSTINIHVSDYIDPVENANITISSEYVAEKTGKTDQNGNLNIVFNAPKTKTEKTCTITITASKEGYPDVQKAFNVNVKPEAEKIPFPPLTYLLVFILVMVLITAVLIIYVIKFGKKK